MTNTTATIISVGAMAVSLFVGWFVITNVNTKTSFGAPTAPSGLLVENYLPVVQYNGGMKTALPISVLASGTSTLFMKSSSATQGFCMEFNATSSNTVLNMTATTTTNSAGAQTGLNIAFGACN